MIRQIKVKEPSITVDGMSFQIYIIITRLSTKSRETFEIKFINNFTSPERTDGFGQIPSISYDKVVVIKRDGHICRPNISFYEKETVLNKEDISYRFEQDELKRKVIDNTNIKISPLTLSFSAIQDFCEIEAELYMIWKTNPSMLKDNSGNMIVPIIK
jgi:hypothetical protein